MKNLLLTILLTGICLIGCKSQKINEPISITPLTIMHETDTFIDRQLTSIDRVEYFLVQWKGDTSLLYKAIDDFVGKSKNTNLSDFYMYEMEFLKASSKITVEAINKNPELIFKSLLIDDPRIITYTWFNGKFGGTIKYKDSLKTIK